MNIHDVTMKKNRYAQIQAGSAVVKNVILGSDDLRIDGYELIKLRDNQNCEPGMYIDRETYDYYYDPALSQKTKTVIEPDS